MADEFLPNDYKNPKNVSNYMKFEEGENKFRILAKPILGFEFWEEKEDESGKLIRRPVRVPLEAGEPRSAVENPNDIKHFWAMPVWNYQHKRVQILEITQKGIQKSIEALAKDADWGSPTGYDIVVIKTGKGRDTDYETKPKPAKKLEDEAVKAYSSTKVNLEALYTGGDPFSGNKENPSEPDALVEEADKALRDK